MNESPATTISGWLRRAAGMLESRLEAQLLLGHALDRDRAWLIAHGNERLEDQPKSRADALLERRGNGEPVAHLLGEREFFSRVFRITPDVLIPRPETETLVELALALELPDQARVADLGTGSGCIAITLAAERPDWLVTATDTSAPALAVTRDNARRLGAGSVELVAGSWFEPLGERPFDLVVSNPPYVAPGDNHLDRGDVRFEPLSALVAGDDGLADLAQIIVQAPAHLAAGGWLVLEIGHDQGHAVSELMDSAGFHRVRVHPDGAGIDRVALGQWPHDT